MDKYYHEPNVVSAGGNATPGSSNGPPLKPECICGLKPKKFYILLAVAVVLIVGAGVGGGVGGALASHSSSKPESSNGSGLSATITSASSISTTIPTATTTSAEQIASVTTTEVAGPTSTLYRDCPSSNNTLYSVTFGSDEYTYRKYCSMSLVDDGTTVVNEPTTNLNSYVSLTFLLPILLLSKLTYLNVSHSCINLCAVYNLQNATEIASGDSQPCNAVCWRNGFVDDEFPGQCFGSTTQNSSTGGFNFDSDEIICDAAGWINQK